MFTFYEVGGKVRDELLGIQSKDIDYTVVLNKEVYERTYATVDWTFKNLEEYLIGNGYQVFLSTPDCLTIRTKFPTDHPNAGTVADFVLARREVGYIQNTRKPHVAIGTLYDDLERRDFTINAIAKDKDGELIDPFHGKRDLALKILRTPIDPKITFNDDPLRLLRAVRFSITKGLTMCGDVWEMVHCFDYDGKMGVVSEERIREELFKCFKHDTLKTMNLLMNDHPRLARYIFDKTKLWLKPTNEQ